MANKDPKIAEKIENYRLFLNDSFGIPNYSPFLCSATFFFQSFDAAREFAKTENDGVEPAAFRIYYGCDPGGVNHDMFIAFLDEAGNVIYKEKLADRTPSSDRRCPPGNPC